MITTRAYRDKFVGTGTNKNPRFPEVNSLSKCTFQLTDAKLYVSVVTYQLKMIINFRAIKNRI